MDLRQTVSAMLGKEVTLEYAKDFADNQFGMLSTYLIENQPKTFVYIMIASEECSMAYSRLVDGELDAWIEEYVNDYTVGKYANNLLDKTLLKNIEDFGSFIFLTEEEYKKIR